MSYAIIRNEKYKRANLKGIYRHNERKNTNYSNKNIDKSRSHLNYHLKEPMNSYEKEFERIKKEYDLKGQIKEVSNIICECIITSDKAFFEEIGDEETKRYFKTAYEFVSTYKDLKEEYILSAVVHMDEETPHMHLVFIPVVSVLDKQARHINKIACSEFWKAKTSYRDLQDSFYAYITKNNFDLDRGSESKREHLSIEKYKEVTNYQNTKKVLESINLEIPETPNIKDIKKIMINRDEKIMNEIIKPKDDLIQELHKDNLKLHKELSRQASLVVKAEKFEKERSNLNTAHIELQQKYNKLEDKLLFAEKDYDDEINSLKRKHQKEVNKLESKIQKFEKVLSNIKSTVIDLVSWVCKKLSIQHENDVIREFEKDTGNNLDLDRSFEIRETEKEYEMEL